MLRRHSSAAPKVSSDDASNAQIVERHAIRTRHAANEHVVRRPRTEPSEAHQRFPRVVVRQGRDHIEIERPLRELARELANVECLRVREPAGEAAGLWRQLTYAAPETPNSLQRARRSARRVGPGLREPRRARSAAR